MKSLAHLNKYLFRYRWHLFAGVIFVVLQNFGAIYPAQVVRTSLDEVIDFLKRSPNPGPSDLQFISGKVFRFFLLIIGVALIRGLLMFFMRQTIIVMSRRIEFDLKNEIYAHYQRLSLSFYRRNNTGDLMNRIGEDVGRVRSYVGPAIMYSINLIVLFILVIGSMVKVNPMLSLYVLAPLPLLSISIYYVSDIMNRKSEEVQNQQSRLSTFVQEAFSGIRILKAFSKEKAFASDFAVESDDYLKKNMGLVKVNAMFYPLMLLLVGISTILVVYIGGKEVLAGRATTGNIAEFILYVNMLTWPVTSLGWVTAIIQRAAASQERINEFLHLEPEITSVVPDQRPVTGDLEFHQVSFTYPDSGIQALENVSFTVPSGGSLAIVGRTGSGKSTLALLLARLYDTSSGEIRIGGRPLREIPLSNLRDSIGYVPQDVFLFSDTIENNIAFGLSVIPDPKTLREVIRTAAHKAAVDDSIAEFPDGYQTMLGERGITLSGGQKQRVSIARALVRKPNLLILDDCLSAVDTTTEEKILGHLRKEMSTCTTIFISHRISGIKHAQQILVLDQGRVVEKGTHDELMSLGGVYYDMHQQQLAEALKDGK